MVTAITMAQPDTVRRASPLQIKGAIYSLCLTMYSASAAADITVTPEIETAAYGFWLRDERAGPGLDKGLAFMAVPTITLTHKGQQSSASINVKNESVWYDDSQRNHKSLTTFKGSSGVSMFDNRLSLQLNAQSGHQVRSAENNIYSDIITGSDNLSKTSSYGANLSFATLNSAAVQTKVNLSYRKFSSDRPEIADGIDSFDNDTLQASVQLAAGSRGAGAFGLLSGNISKTTRQSAQDFEREQASFIAGLPLFANLSAIVRANYQDNAGEGNNNIGGYFDTFKSYGAGLEYRFGAVSYINVTQNRSTRSGELALPDDENEDDKYYATEVYIAPSRRSSLRYRYDRQFFGRTTSVAGQYNMRTVSARLTVAETLQVLSNLDQIFEDLGIFVCPTGSQEIGDCVKPPTNNYQLQPGETLQQFFQSGFDISEELVKRRSAVFNLGYNNRRVKLNLSLSQTEDEYAESLRSRKTKAVSAVSSWQIGRLTHFQLSARHYDLSYYDVQRTDKNFSVETGFKRELNDHATVKLMFRRTVRNSSQQAFDLSENRVWLSYSHRL
ncbi:MAG: hypothetical protein KKE08_04845 [Gammaproteobacteria bacterium]|nr:hypothetical protein [Gammaproteobacteria bacterium]MBU2069244.1 hypothetical protein [Gammaproteobacteria bacterium]MBU2182339.1 hypothetical protein [Gammaproteobacteria bacterium]MBU2204889.1 hypothetical protein [Gammaproteobacteria bacterium]